MSYNDISLKPNMFQSVGISRDKIILITPPPCNEAAWAEQCKIIGDNLYFKYNTLHHDQ